MVAAALVSGCSGSVVADTGRAASSASADPPSSTVQPTATPGPPLSPGLHRLTVSEQAAVVLVPTTANGRLIVFAHGAEGSAESVLAVGDQARADLTAGLVAAGYTVAASDAGGDAWGNAASVEDYRALAQEAAARTGTTSVYLIGESMGGLPAAQLTQRGRLPGLRAYAGIYPVCDLSSVQARFADSILAANGTGTAALVAQLSPVVLDGSVPIMMWASPGDTIVPSAQNAGACVDEARAAGGRAELVSTIGDHGDVSNFDLVALLAFFDSAA